MAVQAEIFAVPAYAKASKRMKSGLEISAQHNFFSKCFSRPMNTPALVRFGPKC